MPERDILQAANEIYADTFGKGDLPMPPGRQLAIVTCMDARLDPAKFLGLEEGDAHVIRNAGGLVTEDAIRSLIISHWLLGTQEVAVIAHTDCGMLTSGTTTCTRSSARRRAPTRRTSTSGRSRPRGERAASLSTIRESPHLPGSLEISGWVYDVRSGRLARSPRSARPPSCQLQLQVPRRRMTPHAGQRASRRCSSSEYRWATRRAARRALRRGPGCRTGQG